MNTNEHLTRTICELLGRGSPLVLASIVKQEDSAPRHAGAKMVIDVDGSLKYVLHVYEDTAVEVSVPDSNILFDIDKPGDYERLSERFQRYEVHSEAELREL